jgi:hypothetical protein
MRNEAGCYRIANIATSFRQEDDSQSSRKFLNCSGNSSVKYAVCMMASVY